MMNKRIRRCGALLLCWGATAGSWSLAAPLTTVTPVLPSIPDPRLEEVFHDTRVWNGMTRTPDGRTFFSYTQADTPGVQLQERREDGTQTAYPDAAWNEDVSKVGVNHAFVQVNSIRIGMEGDLWLVDAGASAVGKKAVKGGARLFHVDLHSNVITRIYDLSPVVGKRSFVDDVRFRGNVAYLSDAGMPALIVLDLSTGAARRVLDNVASTTDDRPLFADGRMLVDKHGKPVVVHADQLEVSPDGATLYFEPGSGPMWKIATRWLDDPSIAAEDLNHHVEKFAETPSTGGTAIDAAGNLYNSDPNRRCLIRITPAGTMTTLICDPRLVWGDAMWIDRQGDLWMPSAQMNRTPGMNHGKNEVQYPVAIYKMKIGIGPSPIDHP